eukprot:TRINITY_DN37357_c0_g1_i1.p1 TRINITY_DN37357_c0_g1~~TRINITY_DN37357_c0_g1_i1.p1  ORF type:complete len:310 (-),score=91.08 TRINITY_DN37357_c0_g1_i1:105-1034(-)
MMSSRKRKISLNCSLSLPPPTPSSSILNTPEILDTVLNIAAEQTFYKFSQPDQAAPGTSSKTLECEQGLFAMPAAKKAQPEPRRDQEVKDHLHIKEEPYNYEFHGMKKKIKIENEFQSPDTDEERRRKRRERNKVAATKCRNKKKEQTTILMHEGEGVKTLNFSLKQEILRLEEEEKHLRSILDQHRPNCVKSEDGIKSEFLSTNTLSSDQIDQSRFYPFGQDINMDGGALNGIMEENVDTAENNEMKNYAFEHNDMKGVKEGYERQVDDGQQRFSFYGTNFDTADTSCGNQSCGSYRFLGVDSRFIVL